MASRTFNGITIAAQRHGVILVSVMRAQEKLVIMCIIIHGPRWRRYSPVDEYQKRKVHQIGVYNKHAIPEPLPGYTPPMLGDYYPIKYLPLESFLISQPRRKPYIHGPKYILEMKRKKYEKN